MANSEKTSGAGFLKNLVKNQCFIPVAALLLLAILT